MAYVYICKNCREGKHYNCEEFRDIIVGDYFCGGGTCVCSHSANPKNRSAFEQETWDGYLDNED